MKKLYMILTMMCFIGTTSNVWAQANSQDHQKLQHEISSLKDKIKNSKDVKTRDLQKLTDLENELQKSQFLNNSRSRR